MDLKNIGKVLRRVRLRKKMTLVEVSKQSGVSVPMLSLLERGERTPALITLMSLSQVYGNKLSWLIKKAEDYRD